ncbi:hypothetical protein HanHA300_Chr08g0274231 [Helianthus annuus]|nr:hypothetical protein HanHA300_Chr08g0274231 [Helianthus annuus]KAJ0553008.1 hypothetical protein HanHA89_Chr08g0291561 [Helianthus annuus]KAJ0721929.1 hypothetical protein HanOQP8_Chr08g0280921 [Helianthus annuus]KAJ0901078.1 hypothetical protein HanPSC8_Chr08g0321071 [Helianthus annuus]
MMCNQARNLILLHRRLWLIHIKIDHRWIYRGGPSGRPNLPHTVYRSRQQEGRKE